MNPLQVRYDGYQNVQVNWLGNDYWFVNIKALYSFGKADNENLYNRNREDIRNNEIISSEEINRQNEILDTGDKFYLGHISTGYAITLSENDYALFTGLNPFYEYSALKTSGIDLFAQVDFDEVLHTMGLLVPIYASLSISDNFGMWGGANLRGQIDNNIRKEEKYFEPGDTNLMDFEFPVKSDYRQKSISTSQVLYLGFKFDHKSGFSVVTNVRGNLSSVQNWFIDLRFSF